MQFKYACNCITDRFSLKLRVEFIKKVFPCFHWPKLFTAASALPFNVAALFAFKHFVALMDVFTRSTRDNREWSQFLLFPLNGLLLVHISPVNRKFMAFFRWKKIISDLNSKFMLITDRLSLIITVISGRSLGKCLVFSRRSFGYLLRLRPHEYWSTA